MMSGHKFNYEMSPNLSHIFTIALELGWYYDTIGLEQYTNLRLQSCQFQPIALPFTSDLFPTVQNVTD